MSMQVTAITHKRKPVFVSIISQVTPSESSVIKKVASDVLEKLGVNSKLLEIAMDLERIALEDDYFIRRRLYPNVDFYSASAYRVLGIPTDLFTPVFAVSRIAGWTAHVLEQLANNRLIRPESDYTGPRNVRYVPLLDR